MIQILFGVVSSMAGGGMTIYGAMYSDKPLGFYLLGALICMFGIGVIVQGIKIYYIQPIIDELKKYNLHDKQGGGE